MTASIDAYRRLEERFHDVTVLGDALRVLQWDQATFMPPGGAAARGEQMARLEVLRHEKITDSRLAVELDHAAEQADDLSTWQRANLREMRRLYDRSVALPSELVAAHAKACSACELVWRAAREDDDFPGVLPYLQSVLDLTRQIGEVQSDALECSLYDALLRANEPDGRSESIDPLFDNLAGFLPDFLDNVLARQVSEPVPVKPRGPFSMATQREVCRRMAVTVGLDFESARMDESTHPFSSGVPEDSRITVRFNEEDFSEGLMAVLHESGHAMYERGRPADWRYQPVGGARGMVLHESQSLLIEMQACRSREFYRWAAPELRQAFNGDGVSWDEDNLHRLATRVTPSHIRVDADEVTYPAHVILRYRLEKDMLAGELALPDLPEAWNQGMRELLGIAAPDDRLGCLQDIHWYSGAWGYFPTYTLGALAAAQLFDTARSAEPDIVPAIGRGNFAPLMDWLRINVHGQGSLLATDELITQATGRPLDAVAFKQHLQTRYLG